MPRRSLFPTPIEPALTAPLGSRIAGLTSATHSLRPNTRTGRRTPLGAALFSLCVLGILCGESAAQDRPPWWDGLWRFRALVTINPNQEWGDAPAARILLHVRQDADCGGRDIRVISPEGQPVPFTIVHATLEGQYLIAFAAPQKQGFYCIYYGNQHADAAQQAAPKQALVYETRPIPKGATVNSWAEAQAALNRAGPAYGAAYWNRVYDAYNPFGPQSDYIGIYRGYIRCPVDGTYRFATLSDQSSFLLVDDQLVTQWIGPHNIHQGQQGEQSGPIYLARGPHRFLYVHFSFGGPARAAAAWMPPGADHFEIIPHPAFPGLPEAEVFEAEWFEQPLCAEFTWRAEGYCEASDATGGAQAQMTAVKFASHSSAAESTLVDRYLWDFGDGQTATEPQPRHVFLAPGTYAVTLSIVSTDGDRTSCTKKVKVGIVWEDLDFPLRKLETFWGQVKDYRLDTLPTASLLGAYALARELEKTREAFAIARELDKRRDQLEPARLYDVFMDLGRYYQDVERQPQKAEQYFGLAIEAAPAPDTQRRFNARFALCDHHFYYLEDYGRAREEYRTLRSDFPQADPVQRRLALIRMGDTYACEGKAQEALEAYREAEADPTYAPDKPKALLSGTAIQQVQSYLRSGNGDEALKRLEEILWLYPTMRLEGEPALLRVKANLLKATFEEARKQADIYIRFARDPNYLPAVHVAAAEACIELGLMQEAAQHYKTVLEDFPESPQVTEARNSLDRLGQ